MGFGVWGLGFGVWGLGFGVRGLGVGVRGVVRLVSDIGSIGFAGQWGVVTTNREPDTRDHLLPTGHGNTQPRTPSRLGDTQPHTPVAPRTLQVRPTAKSGWANAVRRPNAEREGVESNILTTYA